MTKKAHYLLQNPDYYSHINLRSTIIRDNLKKESDDSRNPINVILPPVPPFIGHGDCKLIIIGQDPTIRNSNQRSKITCTLNLNRPGALLKYIHEDICTPLRITLDNLYATNLFKYFYTIPPASTREILYSHLLPNLALLKDEVKLFPDIPIVTLGEPVLKLLVNELEFHKVRVYWDYDDATRKSNEKFTYCAKEKNKLDRIIFPFPHQPSLRKTFYRNTFSRYLTFMKNQFNK